MKVSCTSHLTPCGNEVNVRQARDVPTQGRVDCSQILSCPISILAQLLKQ
jgi:hypothetical protein